MNYNSEGNCKSPTDRAWIWLDLKNRKTRARLVITSQADIWEFAGEPTLAARAACFLAYRCSGEWLGPYPRDQLQSWDHERAAARAGRVRQEFERLELHPFDVGHWFWDSWKWVGGFATEFT